MQGLGAEAVSAALSFDRGVAPPSARGDVGRDGRAIYCKLAAMQPGDSFIEPVRSLCDPKRFRGFVQHWKARHPDQRFETGRCPEVPAHYRIWRTA